MKFAVCNEVFKGETIAEAFEGIAEIGYDGVEVAPLTLAPSIDEIEEQDVAACRRAAEAAGLQVAGLHWIFGKSQRA